MSLRARVARLERAGGDDECDFSTVTLRYHYGEPVPEIPADAPRCSRCGEVHPFYEVIVTTREQVQAFLAEQEREEDP